MRTHCRTDMQPVNLYKQVLWLKLESAYRLCVISSSGVGKMFGLYRPSLLRLTHVFVFQEEIDIICFLIFHRFVACLGDIFLAVWV